MTTVPGGTGQRGRAVTRRVLWAGVLALLLLSGPGVAAVPGAAGGQLAGDGVGGTSVGSMESFVWTLIDFPGVGAIAVTATVQFLADGTVDIERTAIEQVAPGARGGALAIAVTTSTLAYCPPPSLSEPYLAALNGVTGYTLLGTTLVLHSAAGDMTFSL